MSIQLRGKHLLVAAGVAMLGLAPMGAYAQVLTDPATLHVGGTATQAEGSGSGPNTITGSSEFFIFEESGGGSTAAPLDIILSVPEYNNLMPTTPTLSSAGLEAGGVGPFVPETLNTQADAFGLSGNDAYGQMGSGNDIYSFLNLTGDNSVSFTNMKNGLTANGITTTGLTGFQEYVIEAETDFGPKDLLDVLGNLPLGTYIDAYSVDAANGHSFATAFTNTGLIDARSSVSVPLPSTAFLFLGGLGALGWLTRRRRPTPAPMQA